MPSTELTIHEGPRTLAELEAIVERGLQTFVEVGLALLEIRGRPELYGETYGTFDAYCLKRWGWTRQRATQITRSAEVVNMLTSPPENARQAYELSRLTNDPEAVREVWAEVQDEHGSDVTAADVRAAVDRRLNVAPPTEREAVVLRAIDDAQHILEEPETERALYALSRVKFWLYLDAIAVAETAADPAQDAPGYAELAAWVSAIADAMQARARGLRAVR